MKELDLIVIKKALYKYKYVITQHNFEIFVLTVISELKNNN